MRPRRGRLISVGLESERQRLRWVHVRGHCTEGGPGYTVLTLRTV